MKKIKKFRKFSAILLMFAVLIGFTSCQKDETIFDKIVGRTWVGDLGFGSDQDPIESGVYFGGDGFGTDEQVFFNDGKFHDTYNITWEVSDGTIYIRYGNRAPKRELRNAYVSSGRIKASLYINGVFINDIELVLQ